MNANHKFPSLILLLQLFVLVAGLFGHADLDALQPGLAHVEAQRVKVEAAVPGGWKTKQLFKIIMKVNVLGSFHTSSLPSFIKIGDGDFYFCIFLVQFDMD